MTLILIYLINDLNSLTNCCTTIYRTPWRLDASELSARNTHGVSEDVLRKKVGQFKPIPATYYAWFLNRDDSQSMLRWGKTMLKQWLEECPRFKTEFATFSGMSEDDDAIDLCSYYNREACLPSNRRIVHCTANFCGKRPSTEGCEYADSEVVKDNLGKASDLKIFGFVITPRTLGARVCLDEDQLVLWAQDDYEKVFSTDSGREYRKKKKAAKKRSKKTDRQNDEEDQSQKIKFVDFEFSNEFYPISGKGRRAHVTLGTRGEEVRPVTTGTDLLMAVKEEESAEAKGDGCQEVATYKNEKLGVLRRYRSDLWVVYLHDKAAVFDATFTGHY